MEALSVAIYELGRKVACPICLAILSTPVAVLPCTHAFCRKCISTGLEVKPECPLCKDHCTRRNIRISDEVGHIVNLYRALHPDADHAVNHLMLSQLPSLSQLENHFQVEKEDMAMESLILPIHAPSLSLPTQEEASPHIPSPPEMKEGKEETEEEKEEADPPVDLPLAPATKPANVVTLVPSSPPPLHQSSNVKSFDLFDGSCLSDGEEFLLHGEQEEGDEEVCDVCGEGESFDEDPIIFCDGCNVPVHLKCYGVEAVPEGEWRCDPCAAGCSKTCKCELCPNMGGAFKMTKEEGGKWCHVVCAIWIPETIFEDAERIDLVGNLRKVDKRRRRAECSICGRRGTGACIQCIAPSCKEWFHVTCAKRSGKCIMKIIEEKKNRNGVKLEAMCVGHSEEKRGGKENKKVKLKRRRSSAAFSVRSEGRGKKVRKGNEGRRHSDSTMWADMREMVDVLPDRKRKREDEGEKVMLITGSFSEAQVMKITKLCGSVPGLRVVEEWTDQVTHVITQTSAAGCSSKRTLKLLYGIVGGNWILSFGWIMASLLKDDGTTAEEKNFEISKHESLLIPRREKRKGMCLFEGIVISLQSEVEWTSPPAPDRESVKRLVEVGGGRVGEDGTILVVSSDTWRRGEEEERPVVTYKWILDCCTCCSILDMEGYTL